MSNAVKEFAVGMVQALEELETETIVLKTMLARANKESPEEIERKLVLHLCVPEIREETRYRISQKLALVEQLFQRDAELDSLVNTNLLSTLISRTNVVH